MALGKGGKAEAALGQLDDAEPRLLHAQPREDGERGGEFGLFRALDRPGPASTWSRASRAAMIASPIRALWSGWSSRFIARNSPAKPDTIRSIAPSCTAAQRQMPPMKKGSRR